MHLHGCINAMTKLDAFNAMKKLGADLQVLSNQMGGIPNPSYYHLVCCENLYITGAELINQATELKGELT